MKVPTAIVYLLLLVVVLSSFWYSKDATRMFSVAIEKEPKEQEVMTSSNRYSIAQNDSGIPTQSAFHHVETRMASQKNTIPDVNNFKNVEDDLKPPETTSSSVPEDKHVDSSIDTQSTSEFSIRRFGCHRNETPAIFVHLGKAGGGEVRARFAASALAYNRTTWHAPNQDEHYYPLPNGQRAKFCNSKHSHHLPYPIRVFEGMRLCNASSPISMAIACPEDTDKHLDENCMGCGHYLNAKNLTEDDPRMAACHRVYVGHNMMGSEIHWLPPKFLQDWWDSKGKQLLNNPDPAGVARIAEELVHLNPGDKMWCPEENRSRPSRVRGKPNKEQHHKCTTTKAKVMNEVFDTLHPPKEILFPGDDKNATKSLKMITNYSPFYASLPVHRVIVLREPWGWVMSKFFWHPDTSRGNCTVFDKTGEEEHLWAEKYLREYLMYVCGVDCQSRWMMGKMSMDEMEAQATSNLLRSFSVVGFPDDLPSFYDMVSQRLAYIDMSLNKDTVGGRHSSGNRPIQKWCKALYKEPEFREHFREQVPIMRRVERVVEVGRRVNQFQKEELSACAAQA